MNRGGPEQSSPRRILTAEYESGATFSKLLKKILVRFLILGMSYKNIWQRTNLELGNIDAIIIVITLSFFRHIGRY